MQDFNFDNYRGYLILLDVLDRSPDLTKYHESLTRNSKTFFYEEGGSRLSSYKIGQSNYLDETVYVFSQPYFLNGRFILSFTRLKKRFFEDFFSKNPVLFEWWQTKKELLWYIHDNNFFGQNVNSIFYNNIGEKYSTINNPYFIYLECIQEQNIQDDIAIDNLHGHKTLWAQINNTLVIKPIEKGLWEALYFISTFKSDESDHTFQISGDIYFVLKSYVCYHLLNYHIVSMSKFDSNISMAKKTVGESDYAKIADCIYTFNESFSNFTITNLEIVTELPQIKSHNRYFSKRIKESNIRCNPPLTNPEYQLFNRLRDGLQSKIGILEHESAVLKISFDSLMGQIKNKFDQVSTCINIELQKKVTKLTLIMTILTVVLALESKFVRELYRILLDFFVCLKNWLITSG